MNNFEQASVHLCVSYIVLLSVLLNQTDDLTAQEHALGDSFLNLHSVIIYQPALVKDMKILQQQCQFQEKSFPHMAYCFKNLFY